jgi:hypothetical protein
MITKREKLFYSVISDSIAVYQEFDVRLCEKAKIIVRKIRWIDNLLCSSVEHHPNIPPHRHRFDYYAIPAW